MWQPLSPLSSYHSNYTLVICMNECGTDRWSCHQGAATCVTASSCFQAPFGRGSTDGYRHGSCEPCRWIRGLWRDSGCVIHGPLLCSSVSGSTWLLLTSQGFRLFEIANFGMENWAFQPAAASSRRFLPTLLPDTYDNMPLNYFIFQWHMKIVFF